MLVVSVGFVSCPLNSSRLALVGRKYRSAVSCWNLHHLPVSLYTTYRRKDPSATTVTPSRLKAVYTILPDARIHLLPYLVQGGRELLRQAARQPREANARLAQPVGDALALFRRQLLPV